MYSNQQSSHAWSTLLEKAIKEPGKLLAAYSFFHGYSIGNQILALVQCEQRGVEPGPVATYPAWLERGRQVRKGEKALMLCMPITYKDKSDPDSRRTGFIYKNRWFTLSQTEGEPIPPQETPEWIYERALDALAVSETPFTSTDGNVQGYAKGRSISISPIAVVKHKTRFHELAHVVLGHTEEADFTDSELTPRDLREIEAEGVALICCETLQLPGAEFSRGYIQNWMGADHRQEIPERSAQKIFSAADKILKAGRPAEEQAAA